jgi:phosphotriesterase-related protein
VLCGPALVAPDSVGVKRASAPNSHWMHLFQDVLPELLRRGVTDEQIHAMLVDNPRKIFSATGSY